MTKLAENRFIEEGFFLYKNVFPRQECVQWKKLLLVEIEKWKEVVLNGHSDEKPTFSRETLADIPRAIHKGMLQDIAHRHPSFMEIAKDHRLAGCVSPFLGPDLNLYRSLAIFKPTGYKRPVGWHQDMSYWRGQKTKISVWISLDNADRNTGALRFISKSHTQLITDVEKKDEVFSLIVPDRFIQRSKEVLVETEVGDVVIFHSCVIHCSGENKTGKDRYSLLFTYQPSSDSSHHREGRPEFISSAHQLKKSI